MPWPKKASLASGGTAGFAGAFAGAGAAGFRGGAPGFGFGGAPGRATGWFAGAAAPESGTLPRPRVRRSAATTARFMMGLQNSRSFAFIRGQLLESVLSHGRPLQEDAAAL